MLGGKEGKKKGKLTTQSPLFVHGHAATLQPRGLSPTLFVKGPASPLALGPVHEVRQIIVQGLADRRAGKVCRKEKNNGSLWPDASCAIREL